MPPLMRAPCTQQMCDLALLTVEDDAFWLGPGGGSGAGPGPLRPLNFVDVPELQVPIAVAGYVQDTRLASDCS